MQRHVVKFNNNVDKLMWPGLQSGHCWMINYRLDQNPHAILTTLFQRARYEGEIEPFERTMAIYWCKEDPIGVPQLGVNLGVIEFRPATNSLTSGEIVDDIQKLFGARMFVPLVVIHGAAIKAECHQEHIRHLRILAGFGVSIVILEPLSTEAGCLADKQPVGWEQEVSMNGYSYYGRALDAEFDGILIADQSTSGYPAVRYTLAKFRQENDGMRGLSATLQYQGHY